MAALPAPCLACVMIPANQNNLGQCVDMVEVVLIGLKAQCPAELAACTGACMTELKSLMAAQTNPGPKSHNGLRKVARCVDGPPQATCPSGYACAVECGVPETDWLVSALNSLTLHTATLLMISAAYLLPGCVASD
jgi:hypothetical protein